jgi:hypothetical protein
MVKRVKEVVTRTSISVERVNLGSYELARNVEQKHTKFKCSLARSKKETWSCMRDFSVCSFEKDKASAWHEHQL